jgi:hypothetical protein
MQVATPLLKPERQVAAQQEQNVQAPPAPTGVHITIRTQASVVYVSRTGTEHKT